MHKREGFEYEKELRVLQFNEAHYIKWLPRGAAVELLERHVLIACPAIDEMRVVISPFASPEYIAQARQALGLVVASDRITVSPLHAVPRF